MNKINEAQSAYRKDGTLRTKTHTNGNGAAMKKWATKQEKRFRARRLADVRWFESIGHEFAPGEVSRYVNNLDRNLWK